MIVHDCLQLSSFCDESSSCKNGPERPQMCTIVDDCAQIADSGLKPPFESPRLDFPEKGPRKDRKMSKNTHFGVFFRVVKTVFLETVFLSPTETGGFDAKNGENDDLHSTHKNKGLCSSEPETDENDENGGCPSNKTSVYQKQGFRHPDFWGIFRLLPVFSRTSLRSPKKLAWLPLQSLAVKKKTFFCANFGR